jgi:hypothetical protein
LFNQGRASLIQFCVLLQDLYDKMIGSDQEKIDQWEAVKYDYEKMVQNGEQLCCNPDESEIEQLLELGIGVRQRAKCLRYIQGRKVHHLKHHIRKRTVGEKSEKAR